MDQFGTLVIKLHLLKPLDDAGTAGRGSVASLARFYGPRGEAGLRYRAWIKANPHMQGLVDDGSIQARFICDEHITQDD